MMEAEKKFTLIELLVVIAMLAFLITLLLPALNKARDEAKATVCGQRQKNLSIAILSYVGRNNGHFPPVGHWSVKTGPYRWFSWDDRISIYLGRKLTSFQKKRYGIQKHQESPGAEYLFRCPSDDVESAYDFLYRRTYSMIQGVDLKSGAGTDIGGVTWGKGSRQLMTLSDPGGTAVLSEAPRKDNFIGRPNGYASLKVPSGQITTVNGLHGPSTYNYLFADGHVKLYSIYKTMGKGHMSRPLGMWSYREGD